MDKEKVLEKCVPNRNREDERDQYVNNKARAIAAYAGVLITIILMTYKNIKGIESSDLLSVLLTLLSAEALSKYYQTKSKTHLILGVFIALGAIAGLVDFFFL